MKKIVKQRLEAKKAETTRSVETKGGASEKRPSASGEKTKLSPYASPTGKYPFSVALNVTPLAIREAKEALAGAKQAGNYQYQSVSDLVRTALAAYFTGVLKLRNQVGPGAKTKFTFCLDDDLRRQYDDLPSRSRGEILERVLRSFVNQYL